MKKQNLKTKNNEGITLVALVITIIVLLILAVVSIALVVNEGIINHAQNAVDRYNEAQINEMEKLNDIADQISNIGKPATNWWEPTKEEEEKLVAGNETPYGISKTVAVDENSGKGIIVQYKNNELQYIQIIMGGQYQEGDLFCYIAKEYDVDEISRYKWYINEGEGALPEEYTGEFPILVEDLTWISSQSYLNRIINSFNKK